jgi:hypothetical protein
VSQTAQADRLDDTDTVESRDGYRISEFINLDPDPLETESSWHSDQILSRNCWFTAIPFQHVNQPFAEPNWKAETFESPFERNFRSRIAHLSISPRWWLEGVLPPSQKSKEKAVEIFKYLANSQGIVPDRIDPSIEGGLTFTYRNYETNRSMIVEVYNGLEVAGVVNEENTIIYSEDVDDFDFAGLVLAFKKEGAA